MKQWVMRTGIQATDWTLVNLTLGSWQQLDLSAIVPINTIAIAMTVYISDGTVNQLATFRKSSTDLRTVFCRTLAASQNSFYFIEIGVSATRTIDYNITAGMDIIDIQILAWYVETSGSYTWHYRTGAEANDFSIGSGLTANNTFNLVNLSAIIPSGTYAVLIRLTCQEAATLGLLTLARKDGINTRYFSTGICSVNNGYRTVGMIGVTSSRTIQCYVSTNMDAATLTVLGWYV